MVGKTRFVDGSLAPAHPTYQCAVSKKGYCKLALCLRLPFTSSTALLLGEQSEVSLDRLRIGTIYPEFTSLWGLELGSPMGRPVPLYLIEQIICEALPAVE